MQSNCIANGNIQNVWLVTEITDISSLVTRWPTLVRLKGARLAEERIMCEIWPGPTDAQIMVFPASNDAAAGAALQVLLTRLVDCR